MTGKLVHYILIIILLLNGNQLNGVSADRRPHIIFILADDLGWNDVGFHGSSQISTPNIDALAYSGVILNRYYVSPICTPTRSSLMTGKYPIHTGMQHTVLYAAEPRGLPLTEKLMPQYLKELGYRNHIVGKWHLGHFKRVYTPTYRGFESHVGFWTGHQDYNDHTAIENQVWGLDMRRGLNVAYDLHGQYTTDVIGSESVKVIQNHNTSSPLFLYVAHAAVHSSNPYNILPAPDEEVQKLGHIGDYYRRRFAAIAARMDTTFGQIVKALKDKQMLENSIIIFSSDNGGPANGFNSNYASNWPLKGVKNTLWEGGVRASGFVWSPMIANRSRVSKEMMHVTDWLPTIYAAAGGDPKSLPNKLDGMNIWPTIVNGTKSPRNEVLLNIDDIWGSSALTVNNWKIVKGTNYQGKWDNWYGPSGNRSAKSYNTDAVINSKTGITLSALDLMPTTDKIMEIRKQANIKCAQDANPLIYIPPNRCHPLVEPCLFNIVDDPCEQYNLADAYPHIVEEMLRELDKFNKTAIPPANLPFDPRADPQLWNYTWTNFGDYSKNYTIVIRQ